MGIASHATSWMNPVLVIILKVAPVIGPTQDQVRLHCNRYVIVEVKKKTVLRLVSVIVRSPKNDLLMSAIFFPTRYYSWIL